jgi:hypothetical protein
VGSRSLAGSGPDQALCLGGGKLACFRVVEAQLTELFDGATGRRRVSGMTGVEAARYPHRVGRPESRSPVARPPALVSCPGAIGGMPHELLTG